MPEARNASHASKKRFISISWSSTQLRTALLLNMAPSTHTIAPVEVVTLNCELGTLSSELSTRSPILVAQLDGFVTVRPLLDVQHVTVHAREPRLRQVERVANLV